MKHEGHQAKLDLIPTRKSLLARLKDWDDHSSWQMFFDTYWRLIYHFALRQGLSHDEAQEVVQETVVAVAKNIGKFQYNPQVCAFKTWLLGVTRSKIANQFARRARHSSRSESLCDEAPASMRSESAGEPVSEQWEQAWDEEWQKNLMESAIRRVKDRVSIEQYQMFDLFVLKEWPAGEVAKELGMSRAHVYVAKHRITKLIRKEIEVLRARPI